MLLVGLQYAGFFFFFLNMLKSIPFNPTLIFLSLMDIEFSQLLIIFHMNDKLEGLKVTLYQEYSP